MAVSPASYRIIKKAVIIRIKAGEEATEVINSYPKLSDAQKAQMREELVKEGIIEE